MTALAQRSLLKITTRHNDDRLQFFVPTAESKRIYRYLRDFSANDARTMAQTGHAIRKLRLAKGLLQVDLADDIEIASTTVSALECGRMFCTEAMARRLAYGLRCKWTDLVTG